VDAPRTPEGAGTEAIAGSQAMDAPRTPESAGTDAIAQSVVTLDITPRPGVVEAFESAAAEEAFESAKGAATVEIPRVALSLPTLRGPVPQPFEPQRPAGAQPRAAGLPPLPPASFGSFSAGGASAALPIALLLLAGAWRALAAASRQRPTSISLLKRAPPG
jgi:hypothetical protein